MNSSSSPSPADHHLGDRLAALVDGELEHDMRERVLAHLATCWCCKAEADAQRRLKSVFAETAPPPPSANLLARLQGLPGGDDGPGRNGGGSDGFGNGVFGVTQDTFGADPFAPERFPAGGGLGYLPSTPHGPGLLPGIDRQRGFRIHEVDAAAVAAAAAERSAAASRGRRFAFAAAGAVSLAAIALGGAMPLNAAMDSTTRGDNPAPRVAPSAPAPTAAPRGSTFTEQFRRRNGLNNGGLPVSASASAAAANTAGSGVLLSPPAVSTGPLTPVPPSLILTAVSGAGGVVTDAVSGAEAEPAPSIMAAPAEPVPSAGPVTLAR